MNGVTIQAFWLRCKLFLDTALGEWGLFLVLFSVTLTSYGLGRASMLEAIRPPLTLEVAPKTAQILALPPGGYVVASRSGSVYYLPWCPGAQKIASGKQVWFGSEAEAQKAGYTPSKGCKGL